MSGTSNRSSRFDKSASVEEGELIEGYQNELSGDTGWTGGGREMDRSLGARCDSHRTDLVTSGHDWNEAPHRRPEWNDAFRGGYDYRRMQHDREDFSGTHPQYRDGFRSLGFTGKSYPQRRESTSITFYRIMDCLASPNVGQHSDGFGLRERASRFSSPSFRGELTEFSRRDAPSHPMFNSGPWTPRGFDGADRLRRSLSESHRLAEHQRHSISRFSDTASSKTHDPRFDVQFSSNLIFQPAMLVSPSEPFAPPAKQRDFSYVPDLRSDHHRSGTNVLGNVDGAFRHSVSPLTRSESGHHHERAPADGISAKQGPSRQSDRGDNYEWANFKAGNPDCRPSDLERVISSGKPNDRVKSASPSLVLSDMGNDIKVAPSNSPCGGPLGAQGVRQEARPLIRVVRSDCSESSFIPSVSHKLKVNWPDDVVTFQKNSTTDLSPLDTKRDPVSIISVKEEFSCDRAPLFSGTNAPEPDIPLKSLENGQDRTMPSVRRKVSSWGQGERSDKYLLPFILCRRIIESYLCRIRT